jgi:hypothetical protein
VALRDFGALPLACCRRRDKLRSACHAARAVVHRSPSVCRWTLTTSMSSPKSSVAADWAEPRSRSPVLRSRQHPTWPLSSPHAAVRKGTAASVTTSVVLAAASVRTIGETGTAVAANYASRASKTLIALGHHRHLGQCGLQSVVRWRLENRLLCLAHRPVRNDRRLLL